MTARAGIRVLVIASVTLAAGGTIARADEPQAADEPHDADVTETEVVPTGVVPPQLPHELEEKLAWRYKPIPMPLRRAERRVYDIVPGR